MEAEVPDAAIGGTPTTESTPETSTPAEPAAAASTPDEAAPAEAQVTEAAIGGTPTTEAAPDTARPEGDPTPTATADASEAAPGGDAPAGEDGATKVPPPRVPRLVIAIERVGGPEGVRAALAPKTDEKGEPMKWAAVCAEQATGLSQGDPVFLAWIRLAATPVRLIKAEVSEKPERGGAGGRGGGQGGGGGRDGGGGGGGRPGGFGGGGGRGGRGDREDRGPKVTAKDLASAQDGKIGTSVRFVTDDSAERKERERKKKADREAKREAERARLERLGY